MQDRRRSFRIGMLLGRDWAILRVGRDDVDVELKNESSCGFGILCPPGRDFQVGQPFFLRTVAGWFSVKTIRVEKVSEGTLVGFDRGPEVANLDRKPKWVPWVGIILAAAIGLLAIPVVTILLGYYQAQPDAAQPTQPVPVSSPIVAAPPPQAAGTP